MLRYLPTFRQLMFWLGLALVTAGIPYSVLAYRFWNNPPKLSRNIAAELNAPVLAIPDDQKAWPFYREVLIALSVDPPEEWTDRKEFRTYAFDTRVREFLERNEPHLARARSASKLPSLGHTLSDAFSPDDLRLSRRHRIARGGNPDEPPYEDRPSENPQITNVLLAPAGEHRDLTHALFTQAWIAAGEGRGEAAADNLLAAIRFAGQIREIPILVNDLVSLSVFAEAARVWGGILSEHPGALCDQQLLVLEAAAREFAGGELHLRMETERDTFYDLLQRVYTDDGEGDGYLFLPNISVVDGGKPDDSLYTTIIAPLSKNNLGSRRAAARAYDELMAIVEAEIRRPYWECDCDGYEQKLNAYRGKPAYALVYLMAAALQQTHLTGRDVKQQRDAILTASALVRFRRAAGKWPTTLTALVPQYLPELPVDELTGKPLMYQIKDSRPLIYSVGFDGVDDGGDPGLIDLSPYDQVGPVPWERSIGAGAEQRPKGDLILWPTDFSHIAPPPPIDPYLP